MTVKKIGVYQHFLGVSTDTKPTNVGIGSTYLEYDTSELYITYDGTNWVKKSLSPFNDIKVVRSIKTLDAASIYSAGDVMSEDPSSGVGTAWLFPSVVGGNGGAGLITQAQLATETNSASSPVSLYLFIGSPSCELDDHASSNAPVHDEVTASKFIGRIGFTALSAIGTTGDAVVEATQYTASSGLPLPFVCATGTNAIYGVAVCETGLGVAPSSDMMFTLTIEKR